MNGFEPRTTGVRCDLSANRATTAAQRCWSLTSRPDYLIAAATDYKGWDSLRNGDISSVTRLGDILDFEQLFKAFGNNYFAPIFPILRQLL